MSGREWKKREIEKEKRKKGGHKDKGRGREGGMSTEWSGERKEIEKEWEIWRDLERVMDKKGRAIMRGRERRR